MTIRYANTAADAADVLRLTFPRGSNVPTVVRHVSSSGMTRAIQVLAVNDDGDVCDVSHLVARATGWKLYGIRHNGVKVTGAGMDMAFHLVYSLARDLYGDGYALTNRSL